MHGGAGKLAFFHAFYGLRELGHVVGGRCPAEVAAALAAARIDGVLLGGFFEGGFLVADVGQDALGLVFFLDENVADLVFHTAFLSLLDLVVLGFDFFVGDGVFVQVVGHERPDQYALAGQFDFLAHVGLLA